jgi:glycosyltransferase involved in cell wall biosynthesis
METGGIRLHGKARQKLSAQPLITIITVVYNAGQCLEQTILSVLNQEYPNIEYIIIDGASNDDTLSIIKKHDDKISYWLSEPDNGVYDAMNKGIDAATGNWVYFLGAGDVLLNVINNIIPSFTEDSTIYYGDVYRLDLLRIYDGKFSPFKLSVQNICHQAIFYPLNALKEYKFNTKYKLQADYDLNMRCYGDKNFRFKYMPVVICNYEGAGISDKNYDRPFFRDKPNIIHRNFSLIVYYYTTIRSRIGRVIKKTDYLS